MSARTPFGQPANHQVIIDLTGDNENETENVAVSASLFLCPKPLSLCPPPHVTHPAVPPRVFDILTKTLVTRIDYV